MTRPTPPGGPGKADRLSSLIRDQIIAGRYPPGSRLPTRGQLRLRHKVSIVTVQRALHDLSAERLIEARRRTGTFVVADPPHLTDCFLIFNQSPSQEGYSWFDQTLARESTDTARSRGKRIEVCHGVEPRDDNETYVMLCRRARHRSVAGLIFGDSPGTFIDTPLLDTPGIPRVTLGPISPSPSVPPSVNTDYDDWIDKALNFLVSRGRRRIAVIGLAMVTQQRDRLLDGARQRGMTIRPHWLQSPNHRIPAAVAAAANLLMRQPPDDRPDGLIIDDDHFVEHATAGLIAADAHPGDSFDVVAHSNFPWPTRSSLPVKRLGFDARQILHACFDLLDKQRDNQPCPRIVRIPAVFEDELAA